MVWSSGICNRALDTLAQPTLILVVVSRFGKHQSLMLNWVTFPHVHNIAEIRLVANTSFVHVLKRRYSFLVEVGLVYAHGMTLRLLCLSSQSDSSCGHRLRILLLVEALLRNLLMFLIVVGVLWGDAFHHFSSLRRLWHSRNRIYLVSLKTNNMSASMLQATREFGMCSSLRNVRFSKIGLTRHSRRFLLFSFL